MFARVQVVGRARASAALGVVVERQRGVLGRVHCVGLGTRSSEVTRVARATVDVGIGLVHMIGIINSAHAAHQTGAIGKHRNGTCHCCRAPALTHIDGSQIAAGIEHVTRIGHHRGVETAQVKTRQTRAVSEHASHIGHLGCVETAQVKSRQTCAVIEHVIHIGHLGRVEVTQIKVIQIWTGAEHPSHIGHFASVQVT